MLLFSMFEFLLLCLPTSNCYPIEEPTKFLLSTEELNVENIQKPSKLEKAQTVAARNVTPVIAIKSELLDQGRKSLESLRYPSDIFTNFPKTQETVHLENESEQSLVEKTISFPFNDLLVNFFMPIPLLDRIKEEEKYGNTGNNLAGIGKAFINGFENFSNFLNSAFGSTQNIKKKVKENISEALDQIGGKLIGFQ
ncbi:uncharacterized protein LOC118448496 [Vespa mandarinia]|uniref:uncharacterized protein LOC118448496 n=1 Tax=Vespa mandarinia TaxID=7446 RepID=UPI00162022DF|nr:uncharacterized protein LOC118448496 [Vespa mandarinia]XP_035737726.1 uncharacterized protein LOC118448496 [Vespa mandarinia]XP_035737727.1 uncharacterized protein LOC118448496 [Vespa mandarinia]XP_035737728.1 uncharacterized protein LOC118448496 [Vespa mandarinia]